MSGAAVGDFSAPLWSGEGDRGSRAGRLCCTASRAWATRCSSAATCRWSPRAERASSEVQPPLVEAVATLAGVARSSRGRPAARLRSPMPAAQPAPGVRHGLATIPARCPISRAARACGAVGRTAAAAKSGRDRSRLVGRATHERTATARCRCALCPAGDVDATFVSLQKEVRARADRSPGGIATQPFRR